MDGPETARSCDVGHVGRFELTCDVTVVNGNGEFGCGVSAVTDTADRDRLTLGQSEADQWVRLRRLLRRPAVQHDIDVLDRR